MQSDRAGGRVLPAANLQLKTGENKTALEPVTVGQRKLLPSCVRRCVSQQQRPACVKEAASSQCFVEIPYKYGGKLCARLSEGAEAAVERWPQQSCWHKVEGLTLL